MAALKKGQAAPQEYPWIYSSKRQMLHWLPDGPLGTEVPQLGDKPKTACYKCQQLGNWTALCPLIQRDQDQRLLPRWLPKDWGGPLSWPQYNRFTSLEWSQEHKWMWQVSQSFSYSSWGATYLSWLPSLDPSLHRPAPSREPQASHSNRPSTIPLFCVWEGSGFSHSFSQMPDCPRWLLQRDILPQKNGMPFWTPSRVQTLGKL